MAFDKGSAKAPASYNCNHEECGVRFTAAEGYFEAGAKAANSEFLARVDAVNCQHARAHHPWIVGYAKEASRDHSEEWRQWQCTAEGCNFSLRQKLALDGSALTRPQVVERHQPQYAFADR